VNAALLSLAALLVAIVLSITSRINVGLVAIALAWVIGVYAAGMTPDAVMGGFPVSLFLTLAGVTLLFSVAEVNGTLERLANRAVRGAGGSARLLPIFFFAIACVLSSIGPGAIVSVALLIPLAMVIGARAGVPALLTALLVANGANAGNLSPLSSVGIIANSAMAKAGVGGHEWRVWAANFAAHALVSVAAYFLFGGARLRTSAVAGGEASHTARAVGSFDGVHRLTVMVILTWIAAVVVLKTPLGLSAFAAGTLLLLLHAADEETAIRKVPWGIIMMVSGVSLLIALLEKTGGLDLFTTLLARLASPASANGVLAFVTGLISTYSSTSGVVLPAFLPTVPGLVEKLGGGDPLALALSINVGSALVDVSPLSTLGALCVAALSDQGAARVLFNQLLAWGLAMSVVGALLCQLFAPLIASL